jgi:hypothetical protein
MDKKKEVELRLQADACLQAGDGDGYNKIIKQIAEITRREKNGNGDTNGNKKRV